MLLETAWVVIMSVPARAVELLLEAQPVEIILQLTNKVETTHFK
ncbi:hypothetical protein [uncultured Bartonella sp.]|nr:hypothetical protein [uncultured Bartonella sp.]